MTQDALMSFDDALEVAFDILEEMAEDNLEYNDLELYSEKFDEFGAAVAVDVADDWDEQVGFPVDKERFAEINIGIADEEKLAVVLARMLISRDPDEKFCHILWKRDT